MNNTQKTEILNALDSMENIDFSDALSMMESEGFGDFPGLDEDESEAAEEPTETEEPTPTAEPVSSREAENPSGVPMEGSETEAGTEQPERVVGASTMVAVGALAAAVLLILCRLLYRKKKTPSGKEKKSAEDLGITADEAPKERTDASKRGEERTITAPFQRTGESFSVGVVHAIGARKDQQDAYLLSDHTDNALVREKGFLAIVADGMGGLSNGGMVSRMAVSTGIEYFRSAPGGISPAKRLLEMTKVINVRVNQFLKGRGERSGSTLVESLIYDGKLYFLTVGDSRIYLYRGGRLICLNRPHVYAEELALEGVNHLRNLSDMDSDRQKGSLTSYLGAGRLKYLDRNAEGIALVRGDKLMLCSDGIFGTIKEEEMEQALSKNPKEAAELLEQKVYAAGKSAQDNFTAVVIQCN